MQEPPIVVTFGSGNKLNKITMADEDNKRKKSECWSLTGEVYLLYSQCETAASVIVKNTTLVSFFHHVHVLGMLLLIIIYS